MVAVGNPKVHEVLRSVFSLISVGGKRDKEKGKAERRTEPSKNLCTVQIVQYGWKCERWMVPISQTPIALVILKSTEVTQVLD